MHLLKILLVIAALGGAYNFWVDWSTPSYAEVVAQIGSDNGFVPILPPDGAKADTVYVMAPKNCPSDAAQRAQQLAAGLESRGIPVERSDHFRAAVSDPTAEEREALKRTQAVLNGAIPMVVVNGVASANPSVDQVEAEYRSVSNL